VWLLWLLTVDSCRRMEFRDPIRVLVSGSVDHLRRELTVAEQRERHLGLAAAQLGWFAGSEPRRCAGPRV
jgi:hypothetical protein